MYLLFKSICVYFHAGRLAHVYCCIIIITDTVTCEQRFIVVDSKGGATVTANNCSPKMKVQNLSSGNTQIKHKYLVIST